MDSHKIIKEKNFLGSGWSFPVSFSAETCQVSITAYEENISESIRLILFTATGERNMEPQFGSGLQKYFFRKTSETLKGELINTIKMSLLINEPRINVTGVDVEFTDILNGMLEITINYIYIQTNTRHNHTFPFSLMEGTNLK
ncbi:GPW/gp25 family protein [Mucilaginibacter sp. 14171R-50]|uniref:GPW/gp25 family protein n=1 Tax=Mucilaginibacter sp. 14171R-50 TaxID=2703789 RepID=UPI00138D03C8|nr:GPW/gp25 family protein [Mucilaginibacter sp. 14171R-50]QHS56451.1 GPW/gp25 family protein [Mucilaginibacter sp. 14171R-50]